MTVLYAISIHLIHIIISIFAWFNPKARLWIQGRNHWKKKLNTYFPVNEKVIWFHAASLGEFEQGRPLIEMIRKQYPRFKILLTFYSPSGYEVKKHYAGADYITYLPSDTVRNARYFITRVNPAMVFFIKYEFWFFYLKFLHARDIPVYLVSGIFRTNQIFFRWYGGWFRNMLYFFTHIFVQQQESLNLLKHIGISHASISGDTRFDTVYTAAAAVNPIETVSRFVNHCPCMVAGSTWPDDELLLLKMIHIPDRKLKFIIAPHEIHAGHIQFIISRLEQSFILFSEASSADDLAQKQVLIIDNIGMLLSVYQYATIAYVGGGFGKGIHNILEPASFGTPVIFGPNYHKFHEAAELIRLKGAFPIDNANEMNNITHKLLTDLSFYQLSTAAVKNYIKSHTGATDYILRNIFGDQVNKNIK